MFKYFSMTKRKTPLLSSSAVCLLKDMSMALLYKLSRLKGQYLFLLSRLLGWAFVTVLKTKCPKPVNA